MFSLRYLLFLGLLCAFSEGVKANVPLLVWDMNDGSGNAPKTIDALEESLEEVLKETRSVLVVFEESELRQEDLTLCQLERGEKCFKFLEAQKPTYFSDAPNPLDLLGPTAATYLLKDDGTVLPEIFDKTQISSNVIVVKFETPKTKVSKVELLTLHDKLMEKFYKDLGAKTKVFGIYTAATNPTETVESCPRMRVRRAEPEPKPKSERKEFNIGDKFFLVYDNLTWVEMTGKDKDAKITEKKIEITATTVTTNKIAVDYYTHNITLTGPDGNVKFAVKVMNETGYWQFMDVMFGDKALYINETFVIPHNFSFSCCNVTYGNKTNHLRWEGLQFEPNFNESRNTILFSDPWHCTGFTTPAIWSGIFVVALLLIIVAVGICCMLDIRTNDRYDDPKGKTITVTASE